MPPPLSIDEARARVLAAVRPLPAEDVRVEEALGRVLAEDVTAAADVPGFANSAMDGFAVRSGPAGRRLALVGESRAGAPAAAAVGEAEAVRISTGALVPEGADAVLQLELADDDGETVTLRDDVAPGRNVRLPGEDMPAGAVVLRSGAPLGPAAIGVAVAAGRATVRCARRPAVAIVTTGDELTEPGAALAPGGLHDSNALTLAALAARAGARVVRTARSRDTAQATRAALGDALDAADVVIASGGVSVGAHDHVKAALTALGVQQAFWRVALRPGRPTWFGTRGTTAVFGLPGNPVSAMVTFTLFARPALLAMQGAEPLPARTRARLAVPVERSPQRDECVRVSLRDGVATPTGPQGSHVLTSMLGADGLAFVTRGEGEVAAGDVVEVEEIG
jgi:molybdopterin molybdotransferase